MVLANSGYKKRLFTKSEEAKPFEGRFFLLQILQLPQLTPIEKKMPRLMNKFNINSEKNLLIAVADSYAIAVSYWSYSSLLTASRSFEQIENPDDQCF
jgi:hypothetical protein